MSTAQSKIEYTRCIAPSETTKLDTAEFMVAEYRIESRNKEVGGRLGLKPEKAFCAVLR
jgi:hypothetical protein